MSGKYNPSSRLLTDAVNEQIDRKALRVNLNFTKFSTPQVIDSNDEHGRYNPEPREGWVAPSENRRNNYFREIIDTKSYDRNHIEKNGEFAGKDKMPECMKDPEPLIYRRAALDRRISELASYSSNNDGGNSSYTYNSNSSFKGSNAEKKSIMSRDGLSLGTNQVNNEIVPGVPPPLDPVVASQFHDYDPKTGSYNFRPNDYKPVPPKAWRLQLTYDDAVKRAEREKQRQFATEVRHERLRAYQASAFKFEDDKKDLIPRNTINTQKYSSEYKDNIVELINKQPKNFLEARDMVVQNNRELGNYPLGNPKQSIDALERENECYKAVAMVPVGPEKKEKGPGEFKPHMRSYDIAAPERAIVPTEPRKVPNVQIFRPKDKRVISQIEQCMWGADCAPSEQIQKTVSTTVNTNRFY